MTRFKKDPRVVALGRKLREARRTAGYPGQTAACEKLPFGQSTLSDFESGVRPPSESHLRTMMTLYKVSDAKQAKLLAELQAIRA